MYNILPVISSSFPFQYLVKLGNCICNLVGEHHLCKSSIMELYGFLELVTVSCIELLAHANITRVKSMLFVGIFVT